MTEQAIAELAPTGVLRAAPAAVARLGSRTDSERRALARLRTDLFAGHCRGLCPPQADTLWAALTALLSGEEPKLSYDLIKYD